MNAAAWGERGRDRGGRGKDAKVSLLILEKIL